VPLHPTVVLAPLVSWWSRGRAGLRTGS